MAGEGKIFFILLVLFLIPVFAQSSIQNAISSSGINISSINFNESIVVLGNRMSAPELAIYNLGKNEFNDRIVVVPDSNQTFGEIAGGKYSAVVLIGGPSQNSVTKEVEYEGWIENKTQTNNQIIIGSGQSPQGTAIIIVSDGRGYQNVAQFNAGASPLKAFIPTQYVPAAATGISIVLLALINIAKTIFEIKATDIGKKGKGVGQNSIIIHGINVSEIAAIIAASLILGGLLKIK